MSVTATNLIQGPAAMYIADFGSTEPTTIDASPDVDYTDVGGTMDGTTLSIADEYQILNVDQIIYEMGRVRSGRAVSVKTSLAEATLDNLAHAINNTAPVSNVLEGDDGVAAFRPAYKALIIDGLAPGGFRRRITLRKVLQIDTVETSYKKDGQTLFPVNFAIHWISASIKPFKIEDAIA